MHSGDGTIPRLLAVAVALDSSILFVHRPPPPQDTAEFKGIHGRQFGSLLPAPTTFAQPRNQAKVSGIPDASRKDVMKGRWERGAKMKMLDFFLNSQLYQLKIKVLDQPIQTQEARVSFGYI